MARALIDAGKTGSVVTVEKGLGGSRAGFGDVADNIAFLRTVFREFVVEDRVRLFDQELTFARADAVHALIRTPKIAALVHDADGRLDRDFALFFPRLIDDGLVLIDDCEERREFRPVSERYPFGETKELKTFYFTELFVEAGQVRIERVIDGSTLIVRKIPASTASSRSAGTSSNRTPQGLDARGCPLRTVA